MKFKDFIKSNTFAVIAVCFATVTSGITFIFSRPIAFAEFVCVLCIAVIAVLRLSDSVERKKSDMRKLEASLAESGEEFTHLSAFPFPAVLIEGNGDIIWFNSPFSAMTGDFPFAVGSNIREYIGAHFDAFAKNNLKPFEIKGDLREYTVYPTALDKELFSVYFVDDTPLKLIRTKYNITRPVVILINIDSLEQTEDMLAHADYYSVISDLDRTVSRWLVKNNCIFRKFSDGKFIAVTELCSFENMVAAKFNLLDEVRSYRYEGDEMDITLSVGIGKEDSFSQCEISARQALDMARGRGGDQVTVKTGENYEFFGGITNKKERRGKVRSRIVAAALNDHIENSSDVYIMGHSYADFDCLGAAVGIAAIVRSCGKSAYIVINRKTCLALPLIKMIESSGQHISFVTAANAEETINEGSLVVITDTMRKNLVEAPELLSRVAHIVVIDHHRMAVEHIENSALLFHEPYASSTCEMVTELVQYAPSKPKLTQTEAQALMSGMILDTKNFSLRVGVRTFEAAAFLRDRKMDTVAVKKLFNGSIDENINISKIIANAKFYKNYCIAVADVQCSDLRLICSKAADELLNIENVDASFVISQSEKYVNISARSFGKINVQLIMESLGGGGHQSMAACQLPDISPADAVEKLKKSINDYNEKNLQ